MQDHFSVRAAPSIREFLRSTRVMGFVNFTHNITFGQDQITMMGTSPDVFHFYRENKIPTLCTNENGRTLQDGLYLNKYLENQHPDCARLMPLLVKVGRDFNQNYGKHSLHMIKHEANCQHLYSLFFDLEEMGFLQFILNNGQLINDLVATYNDHNHDLIMEGKDDLSRIIRPHYKQFSKQCDLQDDAELTIIHQKLHVPIHLPKQQSVCLRLLTSGKTAKEIARDMQISYRTVEHYLERIKKLLGCVSSKDLIAQYGEQIQTSCMR